MKKLRLHRIAITTNYFPVFETDNLLYKYLPKYGPIFNEITGDVTSGYTNDLNKESRCYERDL